MKNLVLAVVAVIATISVGAQATPMCEAQVNGAKGTNNYTVVKQINGRLAEDIKNVSSAPNVGASYVGNVTLGTVGRVAITVNNAVGETGYAVERIVKQAVDAGDCNLSGQAPGLPAGVNCAIQVPGKVITVALVGTGNVVTGIVTDLVVGVPAAILSATADILNRAAAGLNTNNGILGFPLIIVSGALTATGQVLQVAAYIVTAAATAVVNTTALIICTPFEAISELLNGRVDKFLYTITFGFLENTLLGLVSALKALPPSPCDGIGRDALCQAGPVAPAPAAK